MTTRRKLAVLGAPIAHSKSPTLHRAAYGVLGLPWDYEAVEMTGERLPAFVEGLGPEWLGLSLTMPLKRDVLPLLDTRDAIVDLAGGANTLLIQGQGSSRRLHGYNTDVHGIVAAFGDAGVTSLDTVLVLGGGATAASMLVAARNLGASSVTLAMREPARGESLRELGAELGLPVTLGSLDRVTEMQRADAVVSTLPGGVADGLEFSTALRASSVLFDVAYVPWPSALASSWSAAGGTVVSGLDMLLHQAVIQIRIFVSGDPQVELPEEARVIAAMRAAIA